MSLRLVAIAMMLACTRPGDSLAAPDPAPTKDAPMTLTDPSHTAITLSTPYYPWQAAYDRVKSDAVLGTALKQKMLPALEAAGDPRERLAALGAAADAARHAVAASGRQVDFSFDGMDPVEIDLRVCFFRDLSAAVIASKFSADSKRQALTSLLSLVSEPHPVGLPAPNERVAHTQTARFTAQTMVEVQLESLTQ